MTVSQDTDSEREKEREIISMTFSRNRDKTNYSLSRKRFNKINYNPSDKGDKIYRCPSDRPRSNENSNWCSSLSGTTVEVQQRERINLSFQDIVKLTRMKQADAKDNHFTRRKYHILLL